MFGCDPRLRLRTMNVGVVGLLDYLHWQWGLLTHCCSSLHIRGQQALSVAITRERERERHCTDDIVRKHSNLANKNMKCNQSFILSSQNRVELLAEISGFFYKNEVINFPVDLDRFISRN